MYCKLSSNKQISFENHIFDDNFEILHVSNKGLNLNELESLEINKRKFDNILLNDQLDLNSLPLLNLFSVKSIYVSID